MKPDDFAKTMWGRLVKTPQGYWAFVPRPLPPPIELSWELVATISSADRALSELAGLARNLPNPHLLINPFIRQEAVLSSRIEGTRASLSDLLFFEASDAGRLRSAPIKSDDVQEVANYVTALEYGLARLEKLPFSTRLIREIHAKLMHQVRGEHATPGELRRSQNWIGPPRCTLDEATYVPPPVEEMQEALSDLEKFYHADPPLPPLVRLAMLHSQFEAIHPFLDGNGRIGRLLMTLLLCHEGVLPQPLLYLSAYFERHRDEYYRRLLAVCQKGEWRPWLDFFLNGVAEQSRAAIALATRLLALRDDYRGRFATARSSALLLSLIDYLFESPVVTVKQVAKRLRLTHRASMLNIGKLTAAGLLTEVTGKQRYRLYMAKAIVQLLERPGKKQEPTENA